MTDKEKTQEKLEKIYARYPEERGRVEEVGRKVVEMNRWMVTKAFNHALKKIIDAKIPAEAKQHIDTLEHIMVASPGFTAIRNADKRLKPFFDMAIKVCLILAVIAGLAGLILKLIGK